MSVSKLPLLCLQIVQCPFCDASNGTSVCLGNLMVFTHSSIGNILGQTGRDELILSINTQQIEARKAPQLLGNGDDLFFQETATRLSVLGIFVGVGVEFITHGDAHGDIGTTIGDQYNNDLSNIATLLRVDTSQHGSLQRGGKKERFGTMLGIAFNRHSSSHKKNLPEWRGQEANLLHMAFVQVAF